MKLEREMAVRSVLGASRAGLLGQMLSESALYAVFGASLGTLVAYGLLNATRALLISALNRGADVRMNIDVLGGALAASVLTSILAGLIPALRLSREGTNVLIRSGVRAGTDRSQHRLRVIFIVAQFALALVLVVTSGLLLRALADLRGSGFGFNPDRILTAEIDLSSGRYENRDVIADFYTPFLEKVHAIPGVQSGRPHSDRAHSRVGLEQRYTNHRPASLLLMLSVSRNCGL